MLFAKNVPMCTQHICALNQHNVVANRYLHVFQHITTTKIISRLKTLSKYDANCSRLTSITNTREYANIDYIIFKLFTTYTDTFIGSYTGICYVNTHVGLNILVMLRIGT